MKDTYFRIYKMRNGLKYIYDSDNVILEKFTRWCFNDFLNVPYDYECISDYELPDREDVIYVPEM